MLKFRLPGSFRANSTISEPKSYLTATRTYLYRLTLANKLCSTASINVPSPKTDVPIPSQSAFVLFYYVQSTSTIHWNHQLLSLKLLFDNDNHVSTNWSIWNRNSGSFPTALPIVRRSHSSETCWFNPDAANSYEQSGNKTGNPGKHALLDSPLRSHFERTGRQLSSYMVSHPRWWSTGGMQ